MSRLYFTNLLPEVLIDEKRFHYLVNVMKKKALDEIVLFDGKSGDFLYQIIEVKKKTLIAKQIKKIKDFTPSLDVWLLFAPLKKEATEMVIEKATELGVAKIVPIITKRVNNHNFNIKRAELQAIEASEQCERSDIPEILPPVNLKDLLKNWDDNRALFAMLERREDVKNVFDAFSCCKSKSVAVLVGPEGGLSDEEKELLQAYSPCYMGQRILRAETACISALSIYQAIKGDFR